MIIFLILYMIFGYNIYIIALMFGIIPLFIILPIKNNWGTLDNWDKSVYDWIMKRLYRKTIDNIQKRY